MRNIYCKTSGDADILPKLRHSKESIRKCKHEDKEKKRKREGKIREKKREEEREMHMNELGVERSSEGWKLCKDSRM
jgi:hypothetical protein